MIYINTETKTSINTLSEHFKTIKQQGWIKSRFKGSGAAGSTFESLIGKPVENSENPDFMGIEIKTHKKTGKFPMTLFRATPIGPHDYEIKHLVENFGTVDQNFNDRNKLGGTVSSQRKTKFSDNVYFKLKVDEKEKAVNLLVYNDKDEIIYDKPYWTFDTLKKKLSQKLNILCYIETERKYENGQVYFKYTNINFYYLKEFNNFINLLKNGIITVTFCVYRYTKGNKLGEIYDHGTCFRIYPNNLERLFYEYKQDDNIDVYFEPFFI